MPTAQHRIEIMARPYGGRTDMSIFTLQPRLTVRLPCVDERDRLEDGRLRCRRDRRLLRIGLRQRRRRRPPDRSRRASRYLETRRPDDRDRGGVDHSASRRHSGSVRDRPGRRRPVLRQVLRYRDGRGSTRPAVGTRHCRRLAPERHRQRGEDRRGDRLAARARRRRVHLRRDPIAWRRRRERAAQHRLRRVERRRPDAPCPGHPRCGGRRRRRRQRHGRHPGGQVGEIRPARRAIRRLGDDPTPARRDPAIDRRRSSCSTT